MKKKPFRILFHAGAMAFKEIRSYALLSVTIVLSFSLLLGYLLWTDSSIYNTYKELFSQDRNVVAVSDDKLKSNAFTQALIIHDRQDEYYAAINRSNYEGASTAFIEFMLSAIQEALIEAVQTSGAAKSMTTDKLRWYKIERFLQKNDTITNANVRQMFQVSAATANRILAKLTDGGKVQKIRIGKSWGYIPAQ